MSGPSCLRLFLLDSLQLRLQAGLGRLSSQVQHSVKCAVCSRAARHRRWLAARAGSGGSGSGGSGGRGSGGGSGEDRGGGSSGAVAAAAAEVPGAFLTLAAPHSSETEVKKSRFLTHAWPCASADEAMQLIAARRDASASHNCWGYKVGGGGLCAAPTLCGGPAAHSPTQVCSCHRPPPLQLPHTQVGQQYRSSDDGEPGGTAGRPILAAIEGESLDGVAVLVIR